MAFQQRRLLTAAGCLLAGLVVTSAHGIPAQKERKLFDAAPANVAVAAVAEAARPPHEYRAFIDQFRGRLDSAQSLFEALVENGASSSALSFAMELLRAKEAPAHVLKRALKASELEKLVDEQHPDDKKSSRAEQLLKLLEEGSLLETLKPEQFDVLAGALRLELRPERAKIEDATKLPPVRVSLGDELVALGTARIPKSLADEIRKLRGIESGNAISATDLRAVAADPALSVPKLLGLIGRMSQGADSLAPTLSPITSPRRLREFKNALASSPGCAGPVPGANQPVFSIPGHQGDGNGGATLDEGGPRLRIVQGPKSGEMLLPRGPQELDSEGEAQATRLASQAREALGTENPVFPIELFTGNSVAQCSGAFASGDGNPIALGADENGVQMCEMPYQTAQHCVTPQPTRIRIARLGGDGEIVLPRIAVSRTGDQATIGIRMPCARARSIPMMRIADPAEIAAATMGILFTNPVRHTDDGRRFLVMGLSGGNSDFIGFNANLRTSTGDSVNGGVGTRVGDSGSALAIRGRDGKLVFAGVNSFGVFPPGKDPHDDPSVYALQGGIANGGRRETLDLIASAREKATTPGIFTSAKLTGPATHKGSEPSPASL